MDPLNEWAMANPTRRKRSKKESPHAPTNEERAWPAESRILAVMAHGFTYEDAWHMSFRDYERYTSLAAAWSIPFEERVGTIRRATAADADDFT